MNVRDQRCYRIWFSSTMVSSNKHGFPFIVVDGVVSCISPVSWMSALTSTHSIQNSNFKSPSNPTSTCPSSVFANTRVRLHVNKSTNNLNAVSIITTSGRRLPGNRELQTPARRRKSREVDAHSWTLGWCRGCVRSGPGGS